jgi:hypothetical protein
MSGFHAYHEFMVLRRHFTSDYDAVKYNFKLRLSRATYDRGRDKLFYEKLGKHPSVRDFIVANLVEDRRVWIRDLAYSDGCRQVYDAWRTRNESLGYRLSEDLRRLNRRSPSAIVDCEFNELFASADGSHPPLLAAYQAGDVCVETIALLLELTGASAVWDSSVNPLVRDTAFLARKYSPFIRYDRGSAKAMIVAVFAS